MTSDGWRVKDKNPPSSSLFLLSLTRHPSPATRHDLLLRCRRFVPCLILCSLSLIAGCVERRFIIESIPRKVYINNREGGFTPYDASYLYYGVYNITLEKDGYVTQTFQQKIEPPWWAYPPFDFMTENMYPGKITDIRPLFYEMRLIPRPNQDQLLCEANELRDQGKALPEPSVPSTRPLPPPAAPTIGPPVSAAPIAPPTVPRLPAGPSGHRDKPHIP